MSTFFLSSRGAQHRGVRRPEQWLRRVVPRFVSPSPYSPGGGRHSGLRRQKSTWGLQVPATTNGSGSSPEPRVDGLCTFWCTQSRRPRRLVIRCAGYGHGVRGGGAYRRVSCPGPYLPRRGTGAPAARRVTFRSRSPHLRYRGCRPSCRGWTTFGPAGPRLHSRGTAPSVPRHRSSGGAARCSGGARFDLEQRAMEPAFRRHGALLVALTILRPRLTARSTAGRRTSGAAPRKLDERAREHGPPVTLAPKPLPSSFSSVLMRSP